MSPDARELLAATTLVVHQGPYVLGRWPLDQAPAVHAALAGSAGDFAFVIRDDLELSACLPEPEFGRLPTAARVEADWSVLTLDTVMAWDVVGVLSAVTDALASAGVPVGAATAFSRDHLLVPRSRLDQALAALAPLCAGVDLRD